jgi:uncharacterized protein with GYD domain
MAYYLTQVSFTAESLAKMVREPQNREQAVRPMIEKVGGRVVGMWFSFGDYDSITITEMPDSVSITAIALAVGSSGAVKAIKTTPLITMEEGMQAMRKASGAGYRAP